MLNDTDDLTVTAFTISAGNNDLGSNAEAPSKHDQGEVKNTSDSACTQCHFAHPSQESGVGYRNYILGDAAQYDRPGNFPDPPVCNGGIQFSIRMFLNAKCVIVI